MDELSGGSRAGFNGFNAQELVRRLLLSHDYRDVKGPRSLAYLKSSALHLFEEAGSFLPQCSVPLVASYHLGRDRSAIVDFVVRTKARDLVLLSVKSQQSNGTADEKLEYEIQQLIAAELPAAMFVVGPLQGRDAKEGWRPHVLEQIWERSRYYGASRVLLFRTLGKLERWVQAGMPVAGRGVTSATIFTQFCDTEP